MALSDGFSRGMLVLVGIVVVAMMLFSVTPYFVNISNAFHKSDGACVLASTGTRFDTLAPKGSLTDVNKFDWAGSSDRIRLTKGTSDVCAGTVAANTSYFLPGGETFTHGTGTTIPKTEAEWKAPSKIYQDNASIIQLVVDGFALIVGAAPILAIVGVGGFLSIRLAPSGSIIGIIISLLTAIIALAFFTQMVNFIEIAYLAIEAKRFSVFSNSLAGLAVTVRQFWGVLSIVAFGTGIISAIVGSMQLVRSGNLSLN